MGDGGMGRGQAAGQPPPPVRGPEMPIWVDFATNFNLISGGPEDLTWDGASRIRMIANSQRSKWGGVTSGRKKSVENRIA